jgi:hypothetical protein
MVLKGEFMVAFSSGSTAAFLPFALVQAACDGSSTKVGVGDGRLLSDDGDDIVHVASRLRPIERRETIPIY